MEFSLTELVNVVGGGLVGAALTGLAALWYQRKLYQAIRTLARLTVAAARDPSAVDISFDRGGWPVGINHTLNAEPGEYGIQGGPAAMETD